MGVLGLGSSGLIWWLLFAGCCIVVVRFSVRVVGCCVWFCPVIVVLFCLVGVVWGLEFAFRVVWVLGYFGKFAFLQDGVLCGLT